MAVGFNIQIRNLQAAVKKLEAAPEKLAVQIKGELLLAAEDVRTGATKDAPGNYGNLRNKINVSASDNGFTQSVAVNVAYAAYMEWGTKSKAQVPGIVSAYAAQFKGAGQESAVEFKDAILAWVKRKGIGAKRTKSGKVSKSQSSLDQQKSVAYAIMRSIFMKGVSPHPFFFKHVFLVRKKLEERLKRLTI